MLGVAGGELIIPTMIFLFGTNIVTAGSASILISLSLISVGLWRYWRIGALSSRARHSADHHGNEPGSILGAALGGLAIGVLSAPALKLLLGCILFAAAAKTLLSRE